MTGSLETLSDYAYDLPENRIAQHPAGRRDDSRLMVVWRDTGRIDHARFRDLPEFLSPGDRLIINETRVIPARLHGYRPGSGGHVELLLVRQDGDEWEAMVRPARRLKAGAEIAFENESLTAIVQSVLPSGNRRIRFSGEGDVLDLLDRIGHVPLPPYIRREDVAEDRERYQTVYSRTPGAVAAPTAGLHFTPELVRTLEASGVEATRVLLHVGPGTFKPVEVEDLSQHQIDGEYGEMSNEGAQAINRTRADRGRIVAVGTTSVRLLETIATIENGVSTAVPWTGWTSLFIRPPHTFQLVDALITNFHLPRSTLLMLVAAFAGRELMMEAYQKAVDEGYRFYSYGDAMVVL